MESDTISEPRALHMEVSTGWKYLDIIVPVLRASSGPVEREAEDVFGRDCKRDSLDEGRFILPT